MYDLDAIEAINVDQIVTATDRLLLGAMSKRRPSVRASSPKLSLAVAERTVYVRGPQLRDSLANAAGAVIATSLALWIAVTFARLLA